MYKKFKRKWNSYKVHTVYDGFISGMLIKIKHLSFTTCSNTCHITDFSAICKTPRKTSVLILILALLYCMCQLFKHNIGSNRFVYCLCQSFSMWNITINNGLIYHLSVNQESIIDQSVPQYINQPICQSTGPSLIRLQRITVIHSVTQPSVNCINLTISHLISPNRFDQFT